MTSLTLVLRGLRFYWRTHLAVLLGSGVGAAVLTGALTVGDSVRGSLKEMALARLGSVALACAPADRLFRTALAKRVGRSLDAPSAAVLWLRGSLSARGGVDRLNRVTVIGADDAFWDLGPAPAPALDKDSVAVNRAVADALKLRVGDRVVVRPEKPSPLSREAPLSALEENKTALPMTVVAVIDDHGAPGLGRFSLRAGSVPAMNVFVSRDVLAHETGLAGQANLLLVGDRPGLTPELADSAMRGCWELEDAQLDLRELPEAGVVELRTPRVFLEDAVVAACRGAGGGAYGALTYFVDGLRAGDRSVPYCFVTALGPLESPEPGAPTSGVSSAQASTARPTTAPAEMAPPPGTSDDQIVLTDLLAKDLGVSVGDRIEMGYWVLGPMRQLQRRTAQFTVSGVVKLQGRRVDRALKPDYPGLADVEDCHNWKPGVPIDLSRIAQAEQYWKDYRGTPRAYVTLSAGQKLWANRFGALTAIRWPLTGGARSAIAKAIRARLDPAELGLFFQPVRRQALAAAEQSADFGRLFLGLSFFLIASAVMLVGLLFALGTQQRGREIGTLMAVGFTPGKVRRLLLGEGAVLAVAGGVLGLAGGVGYTRAMLYGLARFWPEAAGQAVLRYHAAPLTLLVGLVAAILVELAAIAAALRQAGRQPVRALLSSGADQGADASPARSGRLPAAAFLLLAGGALLTVLWGLSGKQPSPAAFFASGAMLLSAGLIVVWVRLARRSRRDVARALTLPELARRNAARRRGRSLTVAALLACGSFLIVAVGANRRPPPREPWNRASGTGGFALLGESNLPVFEDLNTPQGRKAHNLPADMPAEFAVLPLRVHDGDDASCLTLDRPQAPRILGVSPRDPRLRGAFRFASTAGDPPPEGPWSLLLDVRGDGAVPAVADETTLAWSLHKSVGDTLPCVNARGRSFTLRIVGSIRDSILQGALVISDEQFTRLFPGEGFRMFLIDAAGGDAEALTRELTAALAREGLDLTPTVRRLGQLLAVENAYLAVFEMLGGLGMVLGSVALGLVVLRNVLQRRGELALLQAVGFSRARLIDLVAREHRRLLLAGMGCGMLSALVAVAPTLRTGARQFPYLSVSLTLAAVLLSGFVWIHLATRLALRGPLLGALRDE